MPVKGALGVPENQENARPCLLAAVVKAGEEVLAGRRLRAGER